MVSAGFSPWNGQQGRIFPLLAVSVRFPVPQQRAAVPLVTGPAPHSVSFTGSLFQIDRLLRKIQSNDNYFGSC